MGRRNKPSDVFKYVKMQGPDGEPLGEDDCWLWTGGVSGKGVPYFQIDSRKYVAYRYVYKLIHPDWDIDNPREFLLHQCKDKAGKAIDNPLCCNPMHVRPGTHLENMIEMSTRGRSGLTRDMCLDILQYRKEFPELTQGQIADRITYKYKTSVTRQAVNDLLRGVRHQAMLNEVDAQQRAIDNVQPEKDHGKEGT